MKCKDCGSCKKGWFSSRPYDYVCIGVKEPFVIDDIYTECTQYEDEDGVYIELFAIKDGIRYNAKIVDIKELASILTNSLMDGIEKLCQ